MAMEQEGTTAHQRHGGGTITDALSLFASRLSHHRYARTHAPSPPRASFYNLPFQPLPASIAQVRKRGAPGTGGGALRRRRRCRAAQHALGSRKLLRESVAEACAAAAVEGDGARLSVADFFARAFALSGDVESCLAVRYEALVLREAKYSDDLQLHVFHEEWSTFAQDSLDNGFYTIASKAFANALVHIDPSHLDSTNSTLKKNKVNDIRGLQTLAKSLSAQRSVQTQSAEYMKRKTSGVSEKCNLHSDKPKLPGNLMFRLGIKTRNTQKLLLSRKRNLEEV